MASKRAIRICTFAVVVAFAIRARAEPLATATAAPSLGAPDHVALSVERLFGLAYVSEKIVRDGATVETFSSTSISAFRQPHFAVYGVPRAAADVFVGRGFSAGAAIGVGYGTETFNPAAGPTTVESMTDVQVAPRLGYVLRLAPWLSIWPRAGLTFTYVIGSIPDASGGQASIWDYALAATVDVPLAVTLVPRVLLTMAPTLDVTFWSTGPGAPLTMEQSTVFELGLLAGVTILL